LKHRHTTYTWTTHLYKHTR